MAQYKLDTREAIRDPARQETSLVLPLHARTKKEDVNTASRRITFLKLDSDSPANLDITSGPFRTKKKAPVSPANAFAIMVLPDPGGPYISTPLGGGIPTVRNI